MYQVAKLIGSTMQIFIVDGIRYTKLCDTEFYPRGSLTQRNLPDILNEICLSAIAPSMTMWSTTVM